MSNMSYCMFQNTLLDLQDCYAHLKHKCSDEEKAYREELILLCRKIGKTRISLTHEQKLRKMKDDMNAGLLEQRISKRMLIKDTLALN